MELAIGILFLAIGVMLLLPPKYDPAIRIKERQMYSGEHPESKGAEWLAWYKEPVTLRLNYLAHGGGDEFDWFYTKDRKAAHRFPTGAAAKERLPVYDGSMSIDERTGVEIA